MQRKVRKVLCSHDNTITIPDLCAVFSFYARKLNLDVWEEIENSTNVRYNFLDHLVSQLLYDEKNKTNSSIQKDRSVFYNIVYKCIQKHILQVRIFRNETTVSWRGRTGSGAERLTQERWIVRRKPSVNAERQNVVVGRCCQWQYHRRRRRWSWPAADWRLEGQRGGLRPSKGRLQSGRRRCCWGRWRCRIVVRAVAAVGEEFSATRCRLQR